MKRLFNNQRGDTIMEVLICIAMLGFMLGAAFSLTNKNQQSARASQERSEANKIAEKQIEYLRAHYAKNASGILDLDNNFCFKEDASVPDTGYAYVKNVSATPSTSIVNGAANEDKDGNYVGDCKLAPNDYNYRVSIWKADNSPTSGARILGAKPGAFVVTVRWDSVKGNGQEEVKMFYTIDQLSAGTFSGSPAIGGGRTECNDGDDNDGDNRIDVNGRPPNLPDPDCTWEGDTSETGPIPATISQATYNFPSWHLLNTGGFKPTRVFTITNPSSVASIRMTTATISGAHPNSFSVISNGCLNRTLAPFATCTVTVQFYPPSGGDNNRLSNAGNKTATLTVNNSSGVTSVGATLSGKAYSDQAGPGDVITNSTQGYLHTYNVACYNNVEACGSHYTGVADNGNLYLGNTYCLWGGWGPGGYGNYYGDANKFIMQGDGNLVFYDPLTYRYASWTHGNPGLWLKIHNDYNYVYLTNGSTGSFVKSIYNNVNGCFN